MRARTHLMRIQRAVYDRLRGYARDVLGNLPPELGRYFREYQRDFASFREVSTKHELLSALQKTHVAFCGDYHTLSQAQKTVVRVLRDSVTALRRAERPLVLALEMVRAADNGRIAAYLEGRLSETAFLKSIGFHRNWGFSWENYRKLFHFARENRIRVVGINGARRGKIPTLRERDRFAASVIADLTAADERALVFVLVGDLHLASSHLPGELVGELRRRGLDRDHLVILQNSERFYWKLAERGLEQRVDVLRVKDNVFCVMNTPPWVKLKSHLRWAEAVSQARAGAGPGLDVGLLLEDFDYTDEIRELGETIQKFLGVAGAVPDDFSVQTPADLSFLNRLSSTKRFTPAEKRAVREWVGTFESLYIPRESFIYLTSLSINHAASQAAVLLHARRSGFRRVFHVPRDDFYSFVWIEALAFLGSKIINHKRKCDGPKDFERIVRQARSHGGRGVEEAAVARAALAHLQAEREGGPGLPRIGFPPGSSSLARTRFHYLVAKRLGALLGQGLYAATMDNRVDRADLRALFSDAFAPAHARRLYREWARRLDAFGYRHIVKTERL